MKLLSFQRLEKLKDTERLKLLSASEYGLYVKVGGWMVEYVLVLTLEKHVGTQEFNFLTVCHKCVSTFCNGLLTKSLVGAHWLALTTLNQVAKTNSDN